MTALRVDKEVWVIFSEKGYSNTNKNIYFNIRLPLMITLTDLTSIWIKNDKTVETKGL